MRSGKVPNEMTASANGLHGSSSSYNGKASGAGMANGWGGRRVKGRTRKELLLQEEYDQALGNLEMRLARAKARRSELLGSIRTADKSERAQLLDALTKLDQYIVSLELTITERKEQWLAFH